MDKRSTDKSDQAVDLEQSSKRKLVKGIAAAPVIMALGHRPAFGQICTLSGFGSIQAGTHMSHHPNYETTPCNTYSHGGWKTVLAGDPDWSVIDPITPFTPFSVAFPGGKPPVKNNTRYPWSRNISSTEYASLANHFLGPGVVYTPDDNDPILLEVLNNGKELSREITNAFLNASYAAASGIPYFSVQQIIDLWNTGQAVTASGQVIPLTPMTDAELVDLLKQTYH